MSQVKAIQSQGSEGLGQGPSIIIQDQGSGPARPSKRDRVYQTGNSQGQGRLPCQGRPGKAMAGPSAKFRDHDLARSSHTQTKVQTRNYEGQGHSRLGTQWGKLDQGRAQDFH